jgi:DeoR/GlpR family transcriptional regulator of sugar metabolism
MTTNISPLKVDRLKKILSIINLRKRVSLTELESELETTRITIQRDLVELENSKLIRRFHGGAMSNDFSSDFYNHEQKKSVQVAAKKEIAAKANGLLQNRQAVCLDASSTVYYLTETLFPANLLVLTCSIDAFTNLSSREDLQVVLAGGRLHYKTALLHGPEMLSVIRKFHFDCAFISAEAFIPEKGFFDPHIDAVEVKRALIESSDSTIIMIDSSKITTMPGICVCENNEVDLVITDKPDLPMLKKTFKGRIL